MSAAGPCPRCGAEQPKAVLYGYPSPLDVEESRDEVVFAGCLRPLVELPWACGRCGTHYGEPVRRDVPRGG